jgi:hypothetical protein
MVNNIALEIPLTIFERKSLSCPAVKITKEVYDVELIKILVHCAYHNLPIVIVPKFTNKLKSISCLVEKGLLTQNKQTGEFEWLI